MEHLATLLEACWTVLGQMAPYLILGFFVSGILSIMISPKWVEKHLGTGKFSSILKATLLGVPLPLCSCGVIPVSASLRQHGANKGATTSFLISTPQTGVDSFLATYSLMGSFFAWFRPISALITGLIGGILVTLFDKDEPVTPKASNQEQQIETKLSLYEKLKAAMKYAFLTLPADISKALIVGIIIAGLISTFVSPDFVSQYIGNYYVTMFMMLAIGIPLYVCSTSSIPIAVGFMHLGVSPGAAFVFLISGPATNAATISVIFKILGKTAGVIYIATIIFGSLAGGLAFDYLNQAMAIESVKLVKHAHTNSISLFQEICSVVMILIMIISHRAQAAGVPCCASDCKSASDCKKCKQHHCSCEKQIGDTNLNTEDSENTAHIISIEGMSCSHCIETVKRTILELPGVTSADVFLSEKRAVYIGTATPDDVIKAVALLGFTAVAKS